MWSKRKPDESTPAQGMIEDRAKILEVILTPHPAGDDQVLTGESRRERQ